MAGRGERPSLTPAQQYVFLRATRVGHGTGEVNATGLVWEYTDRPTLLSREYLLRIEYRRGDAPRAFVKEPDICVLADGRELPHVYKDPLRLCLYLPRSGEWDGSMRIDQTFVAVGGGMALLLRGMAGLGRLEGRRRPSGRTVCVTSEPS
jgi:hypothetical protein